MGKNDTAYQEGFEDGLKHIVKSHVPVKDISESIDKLLDKINKDNKLFKDIINHFDNDISILNTKMTCLKDRKKNFKEILESIKTLRETELECQTKPKK